MTMLGDSRGLRARLQRTGLSSALIDAAWPMWWTDEAESSVSARAELRLSLARKLGLDPRSLLEDDTPRFVWHDVGRFKHLSVDDENERDLLSAFGRSLGAIAIAGVPSSTPIVGESAGRLRTAATSANSPFVRLLDLLAVCWSVGIPVLHVRVFPFPQKRMAAMTVRVGDRWAILLAKDSNYPAHIAFYLAHEIGHVTHGHLSAGAVMVDFEFEGPAPADNEERTADAFALELLTGSPAPEVLPHGDRYSARELARLALSAGPQVGIEPGTLALCFGHATGDWATANAAMPFIYDAPRPVWQEVNRVAVDQLDLDLIAPDGWDYLATVIGGTENERGRR
jgi:hypothetical protein